MWREPIVNQFPYVMLLQRRILGDETHCHAPRRMTWCSWHSARKPTLVASRRTWRTYGRTSSVSYYIGHLECLCNGFSRSLSARVSLPDQRLP